MNYRKMAASVAIGLSLLLPGCIEIENNVAFRDNGEAVVAVEVAVSKEIMAMLSSPMMAEMKKQQGKSDGFPDMLSECGKLWPSTEPLPDGVRSIVSKRGKRGDMETCVITYDVADPIRAVESAKKVDMSRVENAPKQDISLVRLPSGNGYRLKVGVTPAEKPALPPEAAKMAAAMMSAMLADRYITFSVSGQRVENTNGELSADKRKASWKISLVELADMSNRKSLSIEADVINR